MKNEPWPVTIVQDRYGGTYSGATWTAWPAYNDNLPHAPFGGDTEAMEYWLDDHVVGKGDTPQEAYEDLLAVMDSLGMEDSP